MRSPFLKTTVAAMLLVLGLFAGNTWAKKTPKAAEPSKLTEKEYKGTVEVTEGRVGYIEAVKLKTGILLFKHTYNITLDRKGRGLGEQMAGKKVIVKGILLKKGDSDWLTVTEYSEVPPK
jgi:hypothetical protein